MDPTLSAEQPLRAAFRRLSRMRQQKPPAERCDLCSAALAAQHQHLLEPASLRLLCGCDACVILFSGQQDGRYRRVPRQMQYLNDLRLSDAEWEQLHLPINLAFLFHSTAAQRVVAVYPSPAGPTESLLTLDAWQELVQSNPWLRDMEPDVEALLIHRVGAARDYYRVGIDVCYQLVGLLRMHWRGFSGGTTVWEEIARFFVDLRQRSSLREGAIVP